MLSVPDIKTTDEDWDRIEGFMRTYVSKYEIPKRLANAKKRGSKSVTISITALEALVAKAGL